MTLSDILRDMKPIPSVYLRAARLIEQGNLQESKPVNIAVLSTFTSEVLRPYVIVESAARGILARPYFGPFNQIDQSVLDDASPLYDSKPDVVVLAARTEEIAPNLISRFFTLSSADVNNELARIEEWLQRMVEGLRRFSKATILVFNYAPPPFLVAGLSDASLESPQASVIEWAASNPRSGMQTASLRVLVYGRQTQRSISR